MKIVIIGGGVTGLVIAYKLQREALLLEKEKELGGLLGSYKINEYFIEKYYHHFFSGDKELFSLLEELNLKEKIVWLKAPVGYYSQGKIFPLNTPFEILKFPLLNFQEKFKLAFLILKSKIQKKEKLDNILAKDWIIKNAGISVYENFFLPLLKSKFGKNRDKISAAWLANRISLRSNRNLKGEKLGYLKGGFWHFINALKKEIQKRGGQININFEVLKLVIKDNKVEGVLGKENHKEIFIPSQKVIFTAGLNTLKKILDPEEIRKIRPKIQYQGVCCLLFSAKKNLTKNIYWLNIDAPVSFGAIIEHTNFLPFSDYKEHLIYVVSYFQDLNDFLWKASEKEIANLFFSDLKKLFPDFNERNVNWWKISRELDAGPIYEIGYKNKILPYFSPIKGLFLAGMFSKKNYPERSINNAISTGVQIAKIVKEN